MADIKKLPDSRVSAVVEEDESEEERFDYTDSEDQEEDNSMLTVAGSPRRIKPWSFMDAFNPKKQALAIAREIDAKKGIKLELPPKSQPSVSETATAESSTQSTIRRVPSGAKAPPTGHNLRASTPVESGLETGASNDAHDQSIGDVAGQSTPLTMAKITNGKPRETQQEVTGVSKGSSQQTDNEVTIGLRRETMLLRDEISKLNAQILKQQAVQTERDSELKVVEKALAERNNETDSLKKLQQTKDAELRSTVEQLDETKRLLDISERNRLQDSETNSTSIKNLRDEIARKDSTIDEARERAAKIEEKLDKRREQLETAIDELQDRLNAEREAAFKDLRASNADWQKRLDEKEAKFAAVREEYESESRKKICSLQDTLTKKNDDFHNVQRDLRDKHKELEERNLAIEQTNNRFNELQSQQKSISEELAKKEEKLEQVEKELKNVKSSKEELEISNGKEVRNLESQIERLENDLKRSHSAYSEVQSEVTGLSKKLQQANEDNTKLQNDEKLLKSSQDELQKKLAIVEEDLESKKQANDKLQSELQVFKDETRLYKQKNSDRLDAASQLNMQLKDKLKSLTDSHSNLKAKEKDGQAQLQASLKVNEELKIVSAKANDTIEDLRRNCENTQQALQEEQQAHESTTKNAHKVEEYSEGLTKFIENLTLFDLPIGSIMLHTFKKDHQVTCLDPFLTAKNTDILGFHSKNHDQKHNDLEKKLDHLHLKNQQLLSQIETKWKTLVDSQKREISQHILAIDDTKAKLKEAEEKLQDRESRCEKLQDEKSIMLKQKEELIQDKMSLNNQISALQGSTLTDEQNKIDQLLKQIEEVTTDISAIREQVKLESTENAKLKATTEDQKTHLEKLKTTLKNQQALLEGQRDLEKLLNDNKEELTRLQEVCDNQQTDLEEKTVRIRHLEGDDSRSITFEIARQSRPDITKELYDKLMISKVDSIDMIELQNIVKNLILLLEIPFNKLTKKGPLVAMYLKYERPIFSHFANRLHFDLFNEAIDLKRFTNEAYDQYTQTHNMATIKHPLEVCLENLYQRLASRL